MKRSIVFSIVLSIVLLTITAAGASAQTVHYGIQGGTNYFKLTGASFDDKFKFGYSLGGYAEIGYNNSRWGLEPELLFNAYVARTNPNFNSLYQGVSFQNVVLNYISIPILVTYKASNSLTLLAGPQYGYLVFQTQGLVQPPEPKDAFNKNDFSILFGGQLNMFKKMKLGARYVVGFTQLNHIDDNTDNWKSQGLQIYVTYKLK